MADLKSIVRRIRVEFDRAAARRAEREAQDSLKRASNTKGARDEFGRFVTQQESGFGRITRSLGTLRAALAGIAIGFIANTLKNVTAELFRVASAAGDTQAKFETVFGAATARVERFLSDFAALAGMTRTAMREVAANIGGTAQAMGMGQEEAAAFSERVIRLAADMASFNNVPFPEALAAIQSGLRGEMDPLERFAVALTAADIQQRALTDTGKKHADQLTKEEKAVASLNLMYEQATLQVGDLDRTKDSLTNRTRRLEARFGELKERLALALLPEFEKYTEKVSDWMEANEAEAERMVSDLSEVLRLLIELSAFAGKVIVVTLRVASQVDEFFNKPRNGGASIGESLPIIGPIAHLGRRRRDAQRPLDTTTTLPAATATRTRRTTTADVPQRRTAPTAEPKPDLRALTEELRDLAELRRLRGLSAKDAQRAAALEAQLARAMRAGTVEVAERNKALGAIQAFHKDLRPAAERRVKTPEQLARDVRDQIAAQSQEATEALEKAIRDGEIPSIKFTLKINPEIETDPSGGMEGWDQQRQRETFAAWLQTFKDDHALALSVAESTANGVADAWSTAFQRIFDEGATLGDFFEVVAQGMTGALLGGLADYARGKVGTNVAAAIESTAEALAFTAHGNLPAAAASWTAAAKHGAAALAWAAAAGGAAGVASSATGGGRGGGGGPRGTYDVGGRSARDARAEGMDFHFHFDGVDPSNPRHQQLIQATVDRAGEKYGKNFRVHYHRSSG